MEEKLDNKPYVLITNDDGIRSPGIIALAEALQPFCDLLIVAPRNQQTNMGRGALSGNNIGAIEKKVMKINNHYHEAYAVNGSPAQSVAHAILELANRKIDFCVSGVNYGENLGLAYTCSGTLGACFEADSVGIPSIAFSRKIPMEHQRSDEFAVLDWEEEKKHIQNIFVNVMKNGFPNGVRILNVNFPVSINATTEVRVTKQAYMNYGKYVYPDKRDINRGHRLEWTFNDKLNDAPKDSDIYAVHFDEVISVTPLKSTMSVDSKCYYAMKSNKIIET